MASAELTLSKKRAVKRASAMRNGMRLRAGGLVVDPVFCPTDVEDPFDTVEWETRTAAIKGEDGKALFEQTGCEVPKFWSQLATNVVVSKYFYGENGTPEREHSVRQLIHRVSRTIADWGLQDGYFASAQDGETFYRDLTWLCLHQHGAFNSPVWFNVGLFHQYGVKGAQCNWHWDTESGTVKQPENPYQYPQGSACFIQSVNDNMEDIMELARSEAMLFKFGSGTGTDLSTLRSHREKLSGGGRPSGPLSFMRVYDQIAAVVKSGGKTRRAAKMQSLKVEHPDIMEFIECKAKEENKARVLIEKGGYESNFNGEAYSSILFQNANLSVRVSDEFMRAAEADQPWITRWVTDASRKGPEFRARDVMHRMAECAWQCGDPGVQYDTTINTWNTCPNSGRINASNPCVTGDTLVATSEGLRRIDSLVGQTPLVVGLDGKLHRATQVIWTGVKPVYRLQTTRGHELRLTADHLVRTVDGRDVPTKDLKVGERIILGRLVFGSKSISETEATQLGAFFATRQTGPAISARISRLADRAFYYEAMGVRTATEEMDDLSAFLCDLDRNSVICLLREYYESQGRPPINSPNSDVAELLHSFSPSFLGILQLLLLGFGIESHLQIDDQIGPAGDADEDVYIAGFHRLHILPPFVGRFKALMNGENVAIQNGAMLSDTVAANEPTGENEDVYDLTEPVTDHFVANGLVVHNCSEYMFLDDTACNLASINLMKFRQEDGAFDVERFKNACRIFFIAQEILVDHASYPTKRIALNSHLFRPLGLGYSNLGSLLMAGGIPYDSDAARGLCGSMTALLHGAANLTSVELAAAVGPFEGYEKNREPMLNVMQMHRDAADDIDDACPAYLKDAARELWDQVLDAGRQYGFRNAQATVLAPTGTISFLMDCDTTGIEPDIALVKYKQLAGGGMLKIVNNTVPSALKTLGYDQPKIDSILAYIKENDTIEGNSGLQSEHLPVFDCAFKPRDGQRSIAWHAHVSMMAAAQPFLSGAISKTVNMPRESTPDDIADAYMEGWRLGLKALAIYRDGSKESQPLSTSSETDKAAAKVTAKPRRERLPDTRRSLTHKFSMAGHEGYLTVGLYDDGRPGELFITMAKEGSTIGGLMDAFGTAVSMSLQYGVPLEVLVNKFSHTRFEPNGHTKNPDIRIAKSVVDYIFRWMGIEFLPGYREANKGATEEEGSGFRSPQATRRGEVQGSGVGGQESGVRSQESGVKNSDSAQKAADGIGGSSGVKSTTAVSPAPRAAADPKPAANGSTSGTIGHGQQKSLGIVEENAAMLHRAGVAMHIDQNAGVVAREEQFASFQLDAPSCDNCGAITVRNGNCYLCHNCGNSMGCS